MKLNIFHRLLLSHGILILLGLLAGLVSLYTFTQAIDEYLQVGRLNRLMQAAQEAEVQLSSLGRWQRDYLLTGEAAARQQADAAVNALGQAVERLRSQITDPGDREAFEQLVAAVDSLRATWPTAVQVYQTASPRAALDLLRPLDGPADAALRRLIEDNRRRAEAAGRSAGEWTFWASRLPIAILALLVALGVVILFRATRALRYPLPGLVQTAETVAAGNLDPPPQPPAGTVEFDRLQGALYEMARRLRELIGVVRREAIAVATAAAEVDAASQQQATAAAELSAIGREQAATASETAASVQQLSATMEQLARTAEAIADRAAAAQQASEDGQQAVTQTTEAITAAKNSTDIMAERAVAVAEQGRRIGEVAALITDVANRTHLLALNAAIEAASAGEFGRRFSVVAREVKALADLTRQEAASVTELVREIQAATSRAAVASEEATQATERGVEAALRAADALATMLAEVRVIALSTQQQRTAAAQVVATIHDIARAAEQTAEASRQQAIAAEQTAQSSHQQAEAARQLQLTSQNLQELLQRFHTGDEHHS